MPIQFPSLNIGPISFADANPFFQGQIQQQEMEQRAQQIQAQILANEIAKVQSKYAEPMAAGNLQKLQLQNEWDPKIWQSEIGLRGSQSGLANAQRNLTNVHAEWYPKVTQSEIDERNARTPGIQAQSDMEKMKARMLAEYLGPGNNKNNPPSPSFYEQGGASQKMPVSTDSALSVSPSSSKSQPMQQGQQEAPSSYSMYGIEIPQPSHQDLVNKMLFGIDTHSAKRENAAKQIEIQEKEYREGITQAVQESKASQNMNQAISRFNDAMNKSTYRGSKLGNFGAAFIIGDSSAEQDADRAAQQMLPDAVSLLRDAMGQARFSNLDMQQAQKLKFDRTMDDGARTHMTEWVRAINNRSQEQPQFYALMGNPQTGAKKQEADLLWSQYQNDFPLISKDGSTVQKSNLGNWPLYTTPKAIASIRTTGTYSPSKSEKETFMMRYPNGAILPVKKGSVEKAFRQGARPLDKGAS